MQYAIDIIVSYLSESKDLKQNPEIYKIYYHKIISSLYNKGKAPCSIWLNNFNQNNNYVKIVLLGIGAQRKTAFVQLWMDDVFPPTEYDPTIEDTYRSHITLNTNEYDRDKIEYEKTQLYNDMDVKYEYCDIEVIDTAGQTELYEVKDEWIAMGDFFMIMFQINDKRTFEEAISLREKIIACKFARENNKWGIMFVATKCDFKHVQKQSTWLMDDNEIMNYVKKHNIPYVETSAKHNRNVHFAFRHAIYEYWVQMMDRK
eukprot:428695_1